MSPFELMKTISERKLNQNDVSDKDLKNGFFMVNYYLSKDFPHISNALNHKNMNPLAGSCFWINFFSNRRYTYYNYKSIEKEDRKLSNWEKNKLKNKNIT